MSLKAFKWGICLFTLLALGAWGGVIFSVDPESAGLVGGLLFFGSFFAWIMGANLLWILWAYAKGLGEERAAYYLGSIFRQAFLLNLYFTGNLFLLYRGIWTWWVSLLYFSFILLVEFTLRSLREKRATA